MQQIKASLLQQQVKLVIIDSMAAVISGWVFSFSFKYCLKHAIQNNEQVRFTFSLPSCLWIDKNDPKFKLKLAKQSSSHLKLYWKTQEKIALNSLVCLTFHHLLFTMSRCARTSFSIGYLGLQSLNSTKSEPQKIWELVSSLILLK